MSAAARAGRARPSARWIARIARGTVAAVAAAVAVLCAGYAIGAEHFWPIAQAQYLPFPAYLLPAAAAMGLSLAAGWAWRIVAATALGLVLTVVMGLELNAGEEGGDRVRVMTYNVKGYLAIDRPDGFVAIAGEIASRDPDILVLQDAREFAWLWERDAAAARAMFGDRETYSFGQYVVASRFPLRECGFRLMSFRDRPHTYVSCVVVAKGVEVDLVTAHFLTPRHGLNATRRDLLGGVAEWEENVEDRMAQAEALARDLRSRWRPLIVAGDFNAPASSLVVRTLLDPGLRDAFSTAGTGYGYTWGHSLRPGISFLRIDHILVGPELAVADSFVGGAQGSSHRPVIADLYLRRAPG